MKKVITFFLCLIQFTLIAGLVAGLFALDIKGALGIPAGWVSALSDVLGFLSFCGVVAILRDPWCEWHIYDAKGHHVIAKSDETGKDEKSTCSGPLIGLDNARGFGKAAGTNWFSCHGYEAVRFLAISTEKVQSSFSFLSLRKVFRVEIKLARLPLNREEAKSRDAARREKEAATRLKEAEALKASIIESINGSDFGKKVEKIFSELMS